LRLREHSQKILQGPPETAISNGKCPEIVSVKSCIFCLINQGNTVFVLFVRDVRGNDIPVKKRRFLSEIPFSVATLCRDNSPFRFRIKLKKFRYLSFLRSRGNSGL